MARGLFADSDLERNPGFRGLETPDDFTPRHLRQWKNNAEMTPWFAIVHELAPAKLLHQPDDTAFADHWRIADPDTFKPVA